MKSAEKLNEFLEDVRRAAIRYRRLQRRLATAAAVAAQHPLKGGSKFSIEYCVDNRIERRVAVSEPEDDGEQLFRYADTEQQRRGVDDEEWQPTTDKRCHHYTKYDGRSPLPGPCHVTLASLLVVD
jgi:hypothetical protein